MAVPRENAVWIRRRLRAWFREHRRDLPWRRTRDPYAIWVSEVMLQQTQVERVAEYFPRFLAAFPTVESLAAAPLGDVLRLWEGLGYYRRVRSLHAAALLVVREHDGRPPEAVEDLRALPGFGAYTAASVASIAFGVAVASVDTNVMRVVARLGGIRGDARTPPVRDRIERLAAELLDKCDPGSWNQALMDLGALVCRSRAPRCGACPVRSRCRAFASGSPELYPARIAGPAKPVVEASCAVVKRRGRFLLVRRPEAGLLGGLWEFPGGRLQATETAEQACTRGVLEKTGVRAVALEHLETLRHAFSHFSVRLHVLRCRDDGGRAKHDAARWVALGDLDTYPLTRLARRIADAQ